MKTSRSTPYPAVLFKEYEDHSTLGMTVTAEPCLQCVHGKYKWLKWCWFGVLRPTQQTRSYGYGSKSHPKGM